MSMVIVLVIITTVIFFVVAAKEKSEKRTNQTPIKSRPVLTLNEQPTFTRLIEALPEHFVLSQVAFSALITTTGRATRNRFNRKVADFVVLDKSFNVVAVVELDDASHKGSEAKDADRDAMLKEAGYRVIRYKRTPDLDKVRVDFGVRSVVKEAAVAIDIEVQAPKTRLVSDGFVMEVDKTRPRSNEYIEEHHDN